MILMMNAFSSGLILNIAVFLGLCKMTKGKRTQNELCSLVVRKFGARHFSAIIFQLPFPAFLPPPHPLSSHFFSDSLCLFVCLSLSLEHTYIYYIHTHTYIYNALNFISVVPDYATKLKTVLKSLHYGYTCTMKTRKAE